MHWTKHSRISKYSTLVKSRWLGLGDIERACLIANNLYTAAMNMMTALVNPLPILEWLLVEGLFELPTNSKRDNYEVSCYGNRLSKKEHRFVGHIT